MAKETPIYNQPLPWPSWQEIPAAERAKMATWLELNLGVSAAISTPAVDGGGRANGTTT